MKTSKQVFEEQFLQMRERCLSLAADLDRVGRGEGGWNALAGDARLEQLRGAMGLLSDAAPDRARRVLDIFSDPTTALK